MNTWGKKNEQDLYFLLSWYISDRILLIDVFSNPILPQSRFTNRNPILPPLAPDIEGDHNVMGTGEWNSIQHNTSRILYFQPDQFCCLLLVQETLTCLSVDRISGDRENTTPIHCACDMTSVFSIVSFSISFPEPGFVTLVERNGKWNSRFAGQGPRGCRYRYPH